MAGSAVAYSRGPELENEFYSSFSGRDIVVARDFGRADGEVTSSQTMTLTMNGAFDNAHRPEPTLTVTGIPSAHHKVNVPKYEM